LQDVNITIADFEAAFHDFEAGFQHKSIATIEKAIQEFGAGVEEIAVALKDCNATQLMEEIAKLAKDLKSGKAGYVFDVFDVLLTWFLFEFWICEKHSFIKIIYKEVINIFAHGRELTTDFKNAIKYFKERKFQLAGYQVGRIVGILLEYNLMAKIRKN